MPRNSCAILKYLVPEPRLQVAFGSSRGRSTGPLPRSSNSRALWKKYSPKSTRPPTVGSTVHEDVPFVEVPATWTYHDRGQPAVALEPVLPAFRRRRTSGRRRTASASATWLDMTLLQCGVFASSRSASQTRAPEFSALIGHLRLRRSGDLDSSIDKIRRSCSHRPLRRTHLPRLGQEIEAVAARAISSRRTRLRRSSSSRRRRTVAAAPPRTRVRRASESPPRARSRDRRRVPPARRAGTSV